MPFCPCSKKKKKVFVCSKCPKYSNAFRSENEEIEYYIKKREEEKWNIYSEFQDEIRNGEVDIQDQIERFINSKAGPAWFKQLSDRQMKAADDLTDAIAEDSYWMITTNCHSCLQRIGVFPIYKRALRPIIKMSRGNDLAFLWFFLQTIHQRDLNPPNACDKAYSLNERLILSAICHLDMMTTLRQLDKLLPRLKCEQPKCRPRTKVGYICDWPSPYLSPVPKPVVPISVKYALPKIPRIKFRPYESYKNPCFVIKNEKTRWFAHVKEDPKEISSAERIVNDIVGEEINKIPEKFNKMKLIENVLLKNKKFEEKKQILFEAMSEATKCRCENPESRYSKIKKKVIFQLDLEIAKTEEEFLQCVEAYQMQTIVRTILYDLISDINDIQNIQVCENTDKCLDSFCQYHDYIKPECACQGEDSNKRKKCDVYFNRPTKTSPYKFNYEKIFTEDARKALSICPFHQSIHMALNLDKYCTPENALKVCLYDMWQYELQLWNEKYNPEYLCKDLADTVTNSKYIDVCDRDMALKLLKVGLRKLQKNTKYVLAYLPDAHNVPILKEWVLDRYGFRYDYKYRKVSSVIIRRFWDYLVGINKSLKVPKLIDIVGNVDQKKLTWNDHDKYTAMIKKAVRNTSRKVKLWAVKDAERFLETMEIYLCYNKSPHVDTFFAYLPASTYHVFPYRPWQKAEFRDYALNCKC